MRTHTRARKITSTETHTRAAQPRRCRPASAQHALTHASGVGAHAARSSISSRQAVIGLLLVRIVSAILHIVATGTDAEGARAVAVVVLCREDMEAAMEVAGTEAVRAALLARP